jgi:hypothetical protein
MLTKDNAVADEIRIIGTRRVMTLTGALSPHSLLYCAELNEREFQRNGRFDGGVNMNLADEWQAAGNQEGSEGERGGGG